jgi:hypothetical protein
MNESTILVVRGNRIYEDANGHVRLDDLWRAAKATASKQPKHWRTNAVAKALIDELQKNNHQLH